MAKARVKRKKKTANPNGLKQTKRFVVITSIVVLALLALIFTIYSMS